MRFSILSALGFTILFAVLIRTSDSHPATLDKSEVVEILPLNDGETVADLARKLSERNKRTIGMLRQLFPELSEDKTAADNSDNSLAGAESQNNEVRVQYTNSDSAQQNSQQTEEEVEEGDEDDQDTAASNRNQNGPAPLDDFDADADGDDRNKRYLGYGGDDAAAAHGGGSGNFLFDIIRNTADRAARAAGTVYRVVAGTESLGFGLTATSSQTKTLQPVTNPSANPQPKGGNMGYFLQQLVAGSGTSEAADEAANAPHGDGKGLDHHYEEAIPGPITRLFVIANRGISNLVQDLILRLAQTSERIVNFKAKLITSLI